MKNLIERLKSLPYETLGVEGLKALILVSAFCAKEFAESLRIAVTQHPDIFGEMAEEELDTRNLHFADYSAEGDHQHFLWHFVDKYSLRDGVSGEVVEACNAFISEVRRMSDEVRIMSIVSREYELPDIFKRMLVAPIKTSEENPGLVWANAFRYFLEEHIRLDSQPGGHADMLSSFLIDEDKVVPYYGARLNLFSSVFTS